jgi:hypothetical protein
VKKIRRDGQKEIDAFVLKFFPEKVSPKASPANAPANTNGHQSPTLSDEEIIEKCRKAKNAPKFETLFDHGRGMPEHEEDQNRIDLALISLLAFYTQDPDQLDRIFRRSALMRGKWERADYRKRTFDKALGDPKETYQGAKEVNFDTSNGTNPNSQVEVPSQSRSLSSLGRWDTQEEALNHRIEANFTTFATRVEPGPREWIIKNHIWKGHASQWYGDGGVAKSLIAMHMAIHVAAEDPDIWMGFAVKAVPVLYMDFELDADEQHRRALQLCRGMKRASAPSNLHYNGAGGSPSRPPSVTP